MTPQTALELHFADGEYLFDLRLPQLAELEEKRGCGIFELYGRVMRGRHLFEEGVIGLPHEGVAYAADLIETIRLALIGGKRGLVDDREVEVTALRAKALVERYCYDAPLREVWSTAAAILAARIEGFLPPGEAQAGASPAGDPRPPIGGRSSTTAGSSESIGETSPGGSTEQDSGTGMKRRKTSRRAHQPTPND